KTIRTARSRTSGANLFVVLLVMAPPSQELEPPTNPARFNSCIWELSMYECDASCDEILEWFHSYHCQEDVLLLWLGPAKEDESLLLSIIENVNVIDSVIQDKVAFLLVAGSGIVSAARIGEFEPVFNRVRDKPNPSAAIVKNLVANTQSRVADFAMDLGVDPRHLPAIAIITKHGEVFVAPFHGEQDFPALKIWLLTLQEEVAVYREELAAVVMPDPLLVERLQAYDENVRRIDERIGEIAGAMDIFLRHHPEQAAEFPQIRTILTRPGPFDVAAFEAAWGELDMTLQQPGREAVSKQLPRPRVTRALKALRPELPALPDDFPATIVAARANAAAANTRFVKRLRILSQEGIKAGMVVPKSVRNGTILPKLYKQLFQIARLVHLFEKVIPNMHLP
ncbi:hypothetical protein U1839_24625, partial [Sphingomonas sp. RT2P30]|uniref:hypothetical protein n=1 Tax=Parasphingomonas halimpatiens TaxID=3096162 RepID=UPI002FC5DD3C